MPRWAPAAEPDCLGLRCRAGMFLKHIVAWLSMPKCNEKIRSTWVEYWHQVDSGLGERVKKDLQQALKSC